MAPSSHMQRRTSTASPQESFTQTSFQDSTSFWQRKRILVSRVTLPFQLQILKDTGRYDAFRLKWHPSYSDPPDHPPVPNHLFWDSDVAKWIEAACYFSHDGTLPEKENIKIREAISDLVSMILRAQQSDGYLNIHFTVVDPKGRFTNLRDLHELYNAGHLIEAALAHAEWSGDNALLDCLLRYTDLLSSTFGPGKEQKHGYPGHPEIELALLRLHRRTGHESHLKTSRFFIEERGNPTGQDGRHYYDIEAEQRGEGPTDMPSMYPAPRSYWYQQALEPICKQQRIEGHSVRAMYLLTAVADLLLLENNDYDESGELKAAMLRLWSNMVSKKMYMTGGIGATKRWEGFGPDYFLPQSTDEGGCYAETCAAIGVMMLAERLLKHDLDSQFADVLELCLYNAMLGGIALDGKKFTYENQLASSDEQPDRKHEWFTCACCPPNVCRVFGYLGGFLWSSKPGPEAESVEIDVHLYATATLSLKESNIVLRQETEWPWQGRIVFMLDNPDHEKITIRLRIPYYASNFTLEPAHSTAPIQKGYLILDAAYIQKNSAFTLNLPLKPRLLRPDPQTKQNVVALARGPIVYCLEDVDNTWVNDHFKSLVIDPELALKNVQEVWATSLFKDEPFVQLVVPDAARSIDATNKHDTQLNGHASIPRTLSFIPYYLRGNRQGRGQMRVGIQVGKG